MNVLSLRRKSAMTTPALADPTPLWDVEKTATYLGVSERYVLTLVRENGLPSLKVGRNRRFMPAEVELWAASRQRGQR